MEDFVIRMKALRIGSKYQLVRKLGAGTFGIIYLGRNVETDAEVAMKLQHDSTYPDFLGIEMEVYEAVSGHPGFPEVYWFEHKDDFYVMVFELLGPNLEDVFCYCEKKFSLKTTLMIVDQLLSRFEILHSKQYLHRDVKPENFLLGVGEHGNEIYVTDLGLALHDYNDSWTSPLQSSSYKAKLIGTCLFASINNHLGIRQSPRDDMEALGYMMVYFIRGSLPWQGIRSHNQTTRDELVLEQKQKISTAELCEGLPDEFATYLDYVRNLRYHDKPDYNHLRQTFRDLFHRYHFVYDNVYDWTIREFVRLGFDSTDEIENENEVKVRSKEDGEELQQLAANSYKKVKNVNHEKATNERDDELLDE